MSVFILQVWDARGYKWDIVSVHSAEWTATLAKQDAEILCPGRYDVGEWTLQA